jgi:flagellar motor switch protein FliN/FliY
MADPQPQPPADALAQQMAAGNADLADAAQAVKQAAETADQIAAAANSAASPAPAPAATPGIAPNNAEAPGPSAEAAPGADAASPEEEPPLPAPLPNFSPEVQKILAIEVPVIVQLGIRRMSVGEVMRFSVGAIIEFQKAADEELELLANNKGIGNGHAVKVGENFGIKITRIGSVKETIRKLGAA